MKARIFAILGALTLAASFGIVSAQVASAASLYQYCVSNYCLNAWNEGPEVNAYAINHVNNDFNPSRIHHQDTKISSTLDPAPIKASVLATTEVAQAMLAQD
jgi:hypothetical protein